ncbi:MAG: pectate lyase [Vicinamibacteraceae bacterium]|nr:pectate lyase [Vicinamibacteraceae bacterium]
MRMLLCAALLAFTAPVASATPPAPDRAPAPDAPDRAAVLETMKRAATFMIEKVSTRGGYVWTYLPDLSRRWGELEATESMIWVQPPGTASMGHLFLDAYHATSDEFYYRAAEQVARALIWGQHESGGWNYMIDFGGDRALRHWYDTIGKNGWRLEEFHHYYGNATFDDAGTVESARLLLRLYLEKLDPAYKPALDKAIAFVLESQYPIGVWPQRYPLRHEFSHHGLPDYSSFATFNDEVASENIEFLIQVYQTLGDPKVLDAIVRGMNAFLVTQLGPGQPGWALQYTLDLKPAGARTYEPNSLHTGTTYRNVDLLLRFYQITGETKFLARIPEALAWLDSVALPPELATGGRTHPTFVELGTNRAVYVHREGSNVVNGRYYADYDPARTLVHYSGFQRLDVPSLRRRYQEVKALKPADVAASSPLTPGAGLKPLPRFFTVRLDQDGRPRPAGGRAATPLTAAEVVGALNTEGYWLAPLRMTSHPYRGDGSKTPAPGDFGSTNVGDETDTSMFEDDTLMGISTSAFIRNMGVLIRELTQH